MEKKIYEKKSEKVLDFLIGFFVISTLISATIGYLSSGVVYRNILTFISPLVLLAELVGIIYLCRKRKFIGIGLLFAFVVVPLVLLGTCLLLIRAPGIFGRLFGGH